MTETVRVVRQYQSYCDMCMSLTIKKIKINKQLKKWKRKINWGVGHLGLLEVIRPPQTAKKRFSQSHLAIWGWPNHKKKKMEGPLTPSISFFFFVLYILYFYIFLIYISDMCHNMINADVAPWWFPSKCWPDGSWVKWAICVFWLS